ncbi:SDR family NAD(P)-dependent oxidoreductase [Arthrobacter sp. GCM10027362]|uniref:SDR family NAD(P)-dependent oxidoreductase n=1 Tax=Arthrobacter sp. GCM10027362 TaxID=3273379 RepID=UPI00363A579D
MSINRHAAGKTAVVTGASGGIGIETSRRLAQEGYRLALIDYSDEAVAKAVETVREEFPETDLLGIPCDVTSEESVALASERLRTWTEEVQVAALVAGVLQEAAPVAELTAKEFDRVMATNLRGVFLASRALIPFLPQNSGASLVTIASWSGQLASAFFSAYCASKAGVIVFTQALAAELAPKGIRANSISPGNIATGMHTTALQIEAEQRGISFEEMKSIEWAKIPLGYAGSPKCIADAVAFLASSDASYITGTSLDVNGGVHFR